MYIAKVVKPTTFSIYAGTGTEGLNGLSMQELVKLRDLIDGQIVKEREEKYAEKARVMTDKWIKDIVGFKY